MKNVFYVIAVILITGWLIGIFIYEVVGLVETLLVLACTVFLFQSGRKPETIKPDSAAVSLNKKKVTD
jgi:hypothetical protein